jgi:hypothetical protein
VIKNYMESLKQQRDLALEGLRFHHPLLDTYGSNIRVRDPFTVGLLEWWAQEIGPGGVPGGQESYVVPWVGYGPGW